MKGIVEFLLPFDHTATRSKVVFLIVLLIDLAWLMFVTGAVAFAITRGIALA